MTSIGEWLEHEGLGEFAAIFERERVELETLPELTDADLKDLGLPLGPRRKLLKAIRDASGPRATPPAVGAERRQVTVMFCDMVGSTALSGALDPEAYRELLVAYQDAARAAIALYEGYIARYMGDGLLVYFGYPRAHEDDAERAVLASLDIVAAVRGLEVGGGVSLNVRIGIATGVVVAGDIVGEGASEERAVLGEAPNLAARLQSIASPDTIVIADSTARLISGRFDLESLGPRTLKGFSSAVPAFRVAAVEETESRFAASTRGRRRPMVGRDDELSLVLRRWRRAVDGELQLVMIGGEPGIGKSRLVQAVRDELAGEAHLPLLYQCSPFFQSSSLRPFVEQLRRAAGIEGQEAGLAPLKRLERLLRRTPTFVAQDVPLLASLLGLQCELPPSLEDPEERRNATIGGLLRHLQGLSMGTPVVAIFEDVHWADPSTLEVLDRAVHQVSDARVLLLLTYRPEFDCPWVGRPQSASLTLSRISPRETAEVAANVAGQDSLPEALVERIVERTDGIPLFVEELTRAVLESGLSEATASDRLAERTIPSSLHDSLMARLDRLGPAKEIAQAGAIVGREFTSAQAATVAGAAESEVATALATLLEAGLVLQRHAEGGGRRYVFKHALVQDAAYQTLLQSRRRTLHGRAARMLSEHSAPPELVAHHHEAAGNPAEALVHWRKAAEGASRQGAHAEALEYLSKAIRLVDDLPEQNVRDELECDLQLERANSMRVVDQLDGAFAALERAEGLANALHDASRLSAICFLRGNLYFPAGDLERCLQQHTRARDLAQTARDVPKEAQALSGLGDAYYLRGQMITAFRHFDACVELSEKNDLPATVAANRHMRGATRLYRNELEKGLGDARASAELAQEIGETRAELVARTVVCHVLIDQADYAELHEEARRGQVLVDRIRARRFEPFFMLYLGRLEALAGNRIEAQRLLQGAYEICLETGVAFMGGWVLGALASVAVDEAVREQALQDGLRLLDRGCVSHNYLYFCRDATEVSLDAGRWGEAERYAARLEEYTRGEPLPWTNFFIARGRALARWGRNPGDEPARRELVRIRDEAVRTQHRAAIARIDAVLDDDSAPEAP